MSAAQYTATTSSAVALTAATARSILQVITPSTFGIVLKKFKVEFDGVTASAVPVLVELFVSTTPGTPGTGSTSETPQQINGRSITAGFTAASAYTAEPTGLTVIDRFTMTPVGGTIFYDYPLGDEPDGAVSAGMGIRITAPAAVNARGSMTFSRC